MHRWDVLLVTPVNADDHSFPGVYRNVENEGRHPTNGPK